MSQMPAHEVQLYSCNLLQTSGEQQHAFSLQAMQIRRKSVAHVLIPPCPNPGLDPNAPPACAEYERHGTTNSLTHDLLPRGDMHTNSHLGCPFPIRPLTACQHHPIRFIGQSMK